MSEKLTTMHHCPPPCLSGESCREEADCTPGNCPYDRGWKHQLHCVRHICAHDFSTGPEVEIEGGFSRSCACGLTAFAHDMRYAP